MTFDQAVQQILARAMPRVQVKAGNGLSRNMNSSLRSYDQIPVVITRTVGLLADMECLFECSGTVRIAGRDLYNMLVEAHDDWFADLPSTAPGGIVTFRRQPRLPYHQFTAAWTIARRISLVAGRGEIGLHPSVLAQLKDFLAVRRRAADCFESTTKKGCFDDGQAPDARSPRPSH